MADTTMKQLGAFIGGQIAQLKGNVTVDYNSLGKLETFIRELENLIKGTEAGGELDSLVKVKNFLNDYKAGIKSIPDKLDKTAIVNNLTVTNEAVNQEKVLAAPQGKVIKDLIDNLTKAVNEKASKTDIIMKNDLGTLADFTEAFNTAST